MNASAIAVIPARMGSQRLKKKNLCELQGVPLITRAIRLAKTAEVFDEIWVNSEHEAFEKIADEEGVGFHHRPASLASHEATSEQYIGEFLKIHPCKFVFQVHSIAPLVSLQEVRGFVERMRSDELDVLISVVHEQIECALQGTPVNFTFAEKTNSQDLSPVQRLTWSLTSWRRAVFLEAASEGRCATYAGRVGFYEVSRYAGHIIKTAEDLDLAEGLLAHIQRQARK